MGKENSKKLILAAILIVMVIFYGLRSFQTYSDIKNCTEETTAKIVSVETRTKERNDKETTYYYPTVTYSVGEMSFDGTARESSSSSSTYKVGSEISIKYNPDKPSQFIIASASGIDPMLTQLVIPAVIVLLIALYVAFKMIQTKRK